MSLFDQMKDLHFQWESAGIESKLEIGEDIRRLFRDRFFYYQSLPENQYNEARDILKQVTKYSRLLGE